MDSHLSSRELLLYTDGELEPRAQTRVRKHLERCWSCRARKRELEDTIYAATQAYEQTAANTPSIDGPRALLRARLSELRDIYPDPSIQQWRSSKPMLSMFIAAASVLILVSVLALKRTHIPSHFAPSEGLAVDTPDPRLTPGAALIVNRQALCSQPNVKNKEVESSVKHRVFAEYKISGADPKGYEVDYLVTPALGGADDIRNLWPHSYAGTRWNAHVKDQLEDRLRDMVCDGTLDLTEAQHEIAINWISAYKRYFDTPEPLDGRR